MNEYKVEFGYGITGNRKTGEDTLVASTAQEAVDLVRGWYSDFVGFRVERVWIDLNNRWEVTEAWD